MTKLSLWAKRHPYLARTVIVLLHLLLMLLAVYTGVALRQVKLAIPVSFVYIIILLLFTAVLVYPERGLQNIRYNKQQRYFIRKYCDFILATCSFSLVCFAGNNYSLDPTARIAFAAEAASFTKDGETPGAQAILASLAYRDKKTLTRSEKKILKNEFRHQLKIYAKAKITGDDETAAKAVFITLSIIGAVGLTFLLASLACSISCNGSEALAIVVLIAGVAAIIFLLIAVINKIKKHEQKERNFR